MLTEKVTGVEANRDRFVILGAAPHEEDAAEPKGEGVDGAELVDLCVVQVSCHVVLLPVVIYDRRLRVVVLLVLADAVVQPVGPHTQLADCLREDRLHVGVLPLGPIVLISDVCPSDFLIECESFSLPNIRLHLLGLFFLILVILFSSFLFVEFMPTIEVGAVGLLTVDVEGVGGDVDDYFRRAEVLDQDGALWVRQVGDLVPVNYLIILRLIEESEICFSVLVEFEVLLHLLEGR
jgi:hypothetical protein